MSIWICVILFYYTLMYVACWFGRLGNWVMCFMCIDVYIFVCVFVDAVEVKSGADGFMVKMRDGRYMRCVHNNPQGGNLPDYAPHPAIVLKMEDGTGLLLPIIVCM